MDRVYLVIVEFPLNNTSFETSVLIQTSSTRLAAAAALQKICPGISITPQHSPIGTQGHDGINVYTVRFIKSVKLSDIATLCAYYPLHIPDTDFLLRHQEKQQKSDHKHC